MPALNRTAFLALGVALILLSGCDLGTVVEVVRVANLELEPESQPVQLGNTLQLNARATSDRGEQMDPSLVTFSSSNTNIATVASRGVVSTAGPGTVTITASAGGLTARSTVHSVPLPCPSIGTLRPGEPESGEVGPGPCTAGNGLFRDIWFLDITSETSIRIDVTSSQFDSLVGLNLWDGNEGFSLVASDDDGGTDSDSRLSIAISPGVYVIVVAAAFGEAGAYQISIT